MKFLVVLLIIMISPLALTETMPKYPLDTAIKIIEQDNANNQAQIDYIVDLMERARMAPDAYQYHLNLLDFYKQRLAFNNALLESKKEDMITAYAAQLVYQQLYENYDVIRKLDVTKDQDYITYYRNMVDQYDQYLNMLMK